MTFRHILAMTGLALLVAACAPAPAPETPDPALAWGIPEGYALERVAEGFNYLTNIAFVPEPGPRPEDVRYYVTELYGRVLAVRNDGSVEVFYEIRELFQPDAFAEYGIHGLCLAPDQGYIYITWSVPESPDGFHTNHLIRLHLQPNIFGQEVQNVEELGQALFSETAHTSHQIGPCQVLGETLLIGMGEGGRIAASQDPRTVVGKILRFDLDLNPSPGNPYPPNTDPQDYSEFVWASGFRNPYALYALTPEDIYVGDNGYKMDRFVFAEPGANYGWDGTDDYFPVDSLAFFSPSIAPTRLAFVPAGHPAFAPDFSGGFLLATMGNLYYPGRIEPDMPPSILHLPVNPEQAELAGVPQTFMSYRGPLQGLVALALADDGLYFSPFIPESDAGSAIYRLYYDPDAAHPTRVGKAPLSAERLLITEGCTSCHATFGKEIRIGPSLDPAYLGDRLRQRLNSTEYLARLDALDNETDPFLVETRAQRAAVRAANGDERLAVWLDSHLTVTGFDNPASIMPRPDLTSRELDVLKTYLLTEPSFAAWLKRQVLFYYPVPQHRHLLMMFVVGVLVGWAVPRLWALRRRR